MTKFAYYVHNEAVQAFKNEPTISGKMAVALRYFVESADAVNEELKKRLEEER